MIFLGSSLASSQMPDSLVPVLRWDKMGHAVEYGILGVLLCRAFAGREGFGCSAAILLSTLFGVLYGASDEIHQVFVPGRTCESGDLVADLAGSLIGACAYCGWKGRIRRKA